MKKDDNDTKCAIRDVEDDEKRKDRDDDDKKHKDRYVEDEKKLETMMRRNQEIEMVRKIENEGR